MAKRRITGAEIIESNRDANFIKIVNDIFGVMHVGQGGGFRLDLEQFGDKPVQVGTERDDKVGFIAMGNADAKTVSGSAHRRIHAAAKIAPQPSVLRYRRLYSLPAPLRDPAYAMTGGDTFTLIGGLSSSDASTSEVYVGDLTHATQTARPARMIGVFRFRRDRSRASLRAARTFAY